MGRAVKHAHSPESISLGSSPQKYSSSNSKKAGRSAGLKSSKSSSPRRFTARATARSIVAREFYSSFVASHYLIAAAANVSLVFLYTALATNSVYYCREAALPRPCRIFGLITPTCKRSQSSYSASGSAKALPTLWYIIFCVCINCSYPLNSLVAQNHYLREVPGFCKSGHILLHQLSFLCLMTFSILLYTR